VRIERGAVTNVVSSSYDHNLHAVNELLKHA
jgi:hypothetical protein